MNPPGELTEAGAVDVERHNKPVLPTAHTSLNLYVPGPLRRQTGQPLCSQR